MRFYKISLRLILFCALLASPCFGEGLADRVKEHTLKNGMKLLLVERHTSPTVSAWIRFRVGSVDERSDERGLAHLLEHMLFKGTKTLGTIDYSAEKPILDQTNRMYDQLCRLRDLAQFKVQSLSQQADMYAKQRATILASQKALGAAGRIIKGDPQQLAIVDQTIEYLNNEAADTIGAMNDFNRWSEKYLTDMDVQTGANADEATKIFGALEQKLNLPSAVTGVTMVGTTPDSAYVAADTTTPDDYSNLLK